MELFDKLPKDILILIVTDLDIYSISNFCLVYSRLDNYLNSDQSSVFWKTRLEKEYIYMNIQNVTNFRELYKWLRLKVKSDKKFPNISPESFEDVQISHKYRKEIYKNCEFTARKKYFDCFSSVTGRFHEKYKVDIDCDTFSQSDVDDTIKKWSEGKEEEILPIEIFFSRGRFTILF